MRFDDLTGWQNCLSYLVNSRTHSIASSLARFCPVGVGEAPLLVARGRYLRCLLGRLSGAEL